MDILEILYSREFKNINYNVRKITIDDKKLLLLGPRGSGKSSMIFDHLSSKKKGSFLYIDFDDFRLKGKNIQKNLAEFLKKYQIKLLVLENFDFSFDIPECEEIIITSCKRVILEGFEIKILYPLDFEEFIAFDKRELNLSAIFNSYTAIGTFPLIFSQQKGDFVKLYQSFLNSFAKDELEMSILKLMSSYQGTAVSVHLLYQKLKKSMKISKDRFYRYAEKLQDEYIIFLIEKFGSKKSPKKLYMIDFALRSVLNFEKDFIKRFENIIFLELLKRDKTLYYTEVIDFYIEDEQKAILAMPFLPKNMIEDKLKRLNEHFVNLEVATVLVVTMEVEGVYESNGIIYEMIPFWNFATSL